MPGMFFRAFGAKRPWQGQYSTEHRSIAIVPNNSRNRTCRRVGNREQENFAVVVISCFIRFILVTFGHHSKLTLCFCIVFHSPWSPTCVKWTVLIMDFVKFLRREEVRVAIRQALGLAYSSTSFST